jgi:hypothetical protein
MRWGNRSNPGQGSNPPLYPGSFLLAFREALAGLKWQPVRWLGQAVVCRTPEGQEHTVGLDNLYRRARQVPREDWPALVADFLRTVGSVTAESALPDDLNAVAGQLLPRVGPPLNQGPLKVWSRPLGDTGLLATVVVDYPERMTYVTEDLVARSGQPGDAWLGRALDNLQARTPPDWCQVIDEETGIRAAVAGDAYDASRVLLLERLLPETADAGCFVAPVGRDRTFLLPVSLAALQYVHLLKVLADKDYRNTPYPITDQVLWNHGATWRVFPIELKGDEATATPPDELIEVLNRLAGDEEGSEADEETPE